MLSRGESSKSGTYQSCGVWMVCKVKGKKISHCWQFGVGLSLVTTKVSFSITEGLTSTYWTGSLWFSLFMPRSPAKGTQASDLEYTSYEKSSSLAESFLYWLHLSIEENKYITYKVKHAVDLSVLLPEVYLFFFQGNIHCSILFFSQN